MPSLLFVCTGNTCRSPMAMALFKDLLSRERLPDSWRIESAGTWAELGHPASKNTQQVMQERGLDLSSHRSRAVSGGLLRDFDLILVMEARHLEALRIEFPQVAERMHMLAAMAGENRDIEDPYGDSLDAYRTLANELAVMLDRGFERIISLVE